MNLNDLKALADKASGHRSKAERIRNQAESVAELRRSTYLTATRVGLGGSSHGVDATCPEGRKFSAEYKDAAFRRAWERFGPSILRTVEMDLMQQARQETVAADLLQAQLDRMLEAAGAVAVDLGAPQLDGAA